MFTVWFSVSLLVVFLLVIGFNAFFIFNDIKPLIDNVEKAADVNDLIRRVSGTDGANFVLLDEQNRTIASSFRENADITSYDEIRASTLNIRIIHKKVYLTHAENYYAVYGRDLSLVTFYDISIFLLELVVILAAAALLFLISAVSIYARGSYLTRKAFTVVNELIEKAGNISSQNLNLRLNVRDSTDELVELTLTFNRMMDRIEKAYEKQKQFVSNASHELRTPIAVIQGYARMLERWGKDDRAILEESISAINKEAKNMQDLVEKLLFIARNDKDTMVLIKNEFDMSELMRELVRDTEMLNTEHKVESLIKPGIKVFGDPDRIKQALRIFVDNAIKYTEKGGVITIRLEEEDKYAVAVIKDTGIGIPENELPNIFDRFYRVDASRERNKGGHGLGLSIARIIVLRHGGRIKISSKVGGGTRFRVYFPLK